MHEILNLVVQSINVYANKMFMQREFHLSKAVRHANQSFVPTLWVQSILSSWTGNGVQKQDECTMVEVTVGVMKKIMGVVMEEVTDENLDEMLIFYHSCLF